MNNEEKILEMLEKLNSRVDQVQETQEQMQTALTRVQETQEQMQTALTRVQETQEQMQTALTRVAVTQENVVIPQIKLLAEGHNTLLNTLARKDRVEALEDDMALLKTVIKAMSQRIAELEKAQ